MDNGPLDDSMPRRGQCWLLRLWNRDLRTVKWASASGTLEPWVLTLILLSTLLLRSRRCRRCSFSSSLQSFWASTVAATFVVATAGEIRKPVEALLRISKRNVRYNKMKRIFMWVICVSLLYRSMRRKNSMLYPEAEFWMVWDYQRNWILTIILRETRKPKKFKMLSEE